MTRKSSQIETQMPQTQTAFENSFDARDFSARSRALRWQSYFSDFWGKTSITTSSKSSFGAFLSYTRLGDLSLSRLSYRDQEQCRKQLESESFPDGYSVITLCEQGQATINSPTSSKTCRAGDFFLMTPRVGNTLQVDGEFSASQLFIPIPILKHYIPKAPAMIAIGRNEQSVKADLLKNAFKVIVESGLVFNEDQKTVGFVENHILELLALTLETQEDLPISDESSVRFAHRQRLQKIILDNLSNPDLTPALVADLSGLSERYIYRIFSETGHALMQTVYDLRLQRAQKLLQCVERPKKPVGEIGYECGFNSQSHFSRAFRTHVGMSPKTFRAKSESS